MLELEVFNSDGLAILSLSVSKSGDDVSLSALSDQSEKSRNLLSEDLNYDYLYVEMLTLILESLATAVPLTLVNLIVCNSSLNFFNSETISSLLLFLYSLALVPLGMLYIYIKIIK